ncbi:MAG: AAA family ATPase [Proteobacteria bacterium]|nr:AAA family ATPase [Pseudomonadota bacterium]
MDSSPPSRVLLTDGVLDLHVGAIERGGTRLPLTTRELELLRYLAAREGQDVSRDDLLVEVWEYAPGVQSRTVDTTVKRLRKKLEVDASDPRHLLSVHGVGYRLVASAAEAPAPTRTSNLPDDTDSFIGRAAERAALADALQRGEQLITLRGPGGVGKSRLAREFARERADHGDAVVLVELTAATNEADVRAELGSALGLRAAPDDDAVRAAISELVPALILLDDCDAVREIVRGMLPAWANPIVGATLLVTGRQALDLGPEATIQIAPLPVEDALALFRARTATATAIDDDDDDDELLERLVGELDHLPLAIELAAARAAVLSPAEILDRLDQRFRLLASRGRDGRAARLRDTIAWSWDLLEEAEREALIACASFRGGFDVKAAETVVDPSDPDVWVLDLVDSLESKSLLQRRTTGGRSRFFLLNGVRVFATEAGSDGPYAAAVDRHRTWAVRTGIHLLAELDGKPTRTTWARLEAERANLQAAWTGAPDGNDRGELAVVIGRIYERAGSAQVGLDTLNATLAGAADLTPAVQARLLLVRAYLARALNALPDAIADAEAAEAAAQACDDSDTFVLAAVLQAELGTDLGKADEVLAHLDRANARGPAPASRAHFELMLRRGMVLFHAGDVDQADAIGEEMFALARRTGNLDAEGGARRLLAAVRLRRSRIADSWEQANAAQELFAELGDQVKEALVLEIKGVIRAYSGDHQAASHWHGLAVQAYRRLGRRHELPRALGNLARDLLHCGDESEARRVALEAIAASREQGALRQELEARTLVGTVALAEGRLDDAVAAYSDAVEQAQAASLTIMTGIAQACRAIALLVSGRLDEARDASDAAIAASKAAGDRLGLTYHVATRAALEAEADHVDEAESLLARAISTAPHAGIVWLELCTGFVAAARVRAGIDVETNRKAWQEAADHPPNSAFDRAFRDRLRTRL